MIREPSMGPRLVGRGKRDRRPQAPERNSGFNGAASCGTRKEARTGTIAPLGMCFNGAASCGTRKDQPLLRNRS